MGFTYEARVIVPQLTSSSSRGWRLAEGGGYNLFGFVSFASFAG